MADYLKRWLASGPLQRRVSVRTLEGYTYYAEKHLISPPPHEIGDALLSNLTAQDLDELYDRKLDAGVGVRTVRYAHQTVSVALQNAVKKRLIPHNPARDADPPPMPRRKETVTLTFEEVEAFVSAANGTRFEAVFILGLCTGLRPGELLGALWEDLDLPDTSSEDGTLYVRRALAETKRHGLVPRDTTKTNRSRAIALMPEAIAVLRAHRARQAEEELRYKGLREDLGLIFPNTTGGYMANSNLSQRYFKPILKKAGLPKETRFYDLRHAFATNWIEAGESVEVLQKVLGHSSYQITVDRYVKISSEFQRSSIARFAERHAERRRTQ
ncbi:MAG: tyrosine-type recombinase/integrase [Rubrobacteraceae bacterium]